MSCSVLHWHRQDQQPSLHLTGKSHHNSNLLGHQVLQDHVSQVVRYQSAQDIGQPQLEF